MLTPHTLHLSPGGVVLCMEDNCIIIIIIMINKIGSDSACLNATFDFENGACSS